MTSPVRIGLLPAAVGELRVGCEVLHAQLAVGGR
jgi:hypothetical protein